MQIRRFVSLGLAVGLGAIAVPAFAQTSSTTPPPASETRPATSTINGDTGLWFVPTGEVLPAKKWSVSAYRVNFDRDQGFTDVSDWPLTLGVGLGDRAELFGAWTVVRRIDRDVRPLFVASQPIAGGVVNEHPFVRQGWSGNQLGDFWVGATINLTSQWRQQPAAVALRGMVKLPTAKDDEEGVGTGKADFALDAIVSKEVNQRVELRGGDAARGSERGGFEQRAALGRGPGGPLAQEPALHGGTDRRALLQRRGDAHDAGGGD